VALERLACMPDVIADANEGERMAAPAEAEELLLIAPLIAPISG
jgi:hypothetical protein